MSSNSILPILWWLAKARNTLADPPFPTNSFRKLIQLLDHGRTFSEAIQSLRTNPVIRADPAFNVTLRIIQHASEKPEQKAVTLYTAQTPLYGILNALLRRPPADWNQPNFQNEFQPFAAYIPFLLDGLKNACPLHPAGLPKYRIVRGDVWHTDPQDPTPQSYQTGDMYLETTFLSASGSGDADWNNVASFAPNVNVYTRFIILNCPHGRHISGLSFHPQEDEVLFPPGIQFEVLSVVRRTPTKCPACNNPGVACSHCGIARRLAVIEVTLNFTPTNSSPWAAAGTGVDPSNVPTAKSAYTPQEYPKPPKTVEPNVKPMPDKPNLRPMPNRADYTPKIKKVSVKNTGFRKHAALYGKKTVLIDENTGIRGQGVGSNKDSSFRRAKADVAKNANSHYENKYNKDVKSVQQDNANTMSDYNDKLKGAQQHNADAGADAKQQNAQNENTWQEQKQQTDQLNKENEQYAQQQASATNAAQVNKRIHSDGKAGAMVGGMIAGGMAAYKVVTDAELANEHDTVLKKAGYVASNAASGGVRGYVGAAACSFARHVLKAGTKTNALVGGAVSTGFDVYNDARAGKGFSIARTAKSLGKNSAVSLVAVGTICATGATMLPALGISFAVGWAGEKLAGNKS